MLATLEDRSLIIREPNKGAVIAAADMDATYGLYEVREQQLGMWLKVNGRTLQDGNTRTMIFDVKTIVSYLSRYMTLMPGDIIATGTPAGVGMGKKPEPIWLKAGDVVELGIDGLSRQRQRIVPYRWI